MPECLPVLPVHFLIAYEDLGAEALRKLYVEDMPLVVIIDCEGNDLYKEGREAYLANKK